MPDTDSNENCPMCGMPKKFRPWNEFAEPQCWNWRAKVCGECPYETEDGEERNDA